MFFINSKLVYEYSKVTYHVVNDFEKKNPLYNREIENLHAILDIWIIDSIE